MHTQTFGTTRMHYNSDFSGEAIVQDDRSKKQISIPIPDLLALTRFVEFENAASNEHLEDCKVCGRPPRVPTSINGGDHRHHVVMCPDCGVEVCALDVASAQKIWNRLMSDGA